MTAYEINSLISRALYIRDVYVPVKEDQKVITDLCNLVTDNMNVIAEDFEEDE